MKQLIHGCLIDNEDAINEDYINEVLEELGLDEGIKDEALAIVSGEDSFNIRGNGSDFFLSPNDGTEYRCIHEDDIDSIFNFEAEDLYDVDMWRESVNAGNTTDGYDDWLQEILDEGDYGAFFGSYDGDYTTSKQFYIFRVN